MGNLPFGEEAPVDKQELMQRFQEARRIFQQGGKTAALQILCELDKTCPNQPEFLYQMGVVRHELNHDRDAEMIAQRLLNEFKDPRGDKILALIEKKRKARAEEILQGSPALALQEAREQASPAKPETGGLMARLGKRAGKPDDSFADKLWGCLLASIGLLFFGGIAFGLAGPVGVVPVFLIYLVVAGRIAARK